MILTTQKCYTVPLSEKVQISGMRVEPGRKLEQEIAAGKLRLKDNWNIQIIYTPLVSPTQAEPSFLEFPVLWEDEFEWNQDLPCHVIFSYEKIPHSISSHIWEKNRSVMLDLTLEATIRAELNAAPQDSSPEKKKCTQPDGNSLNLNTQNDNKLALQKISALEDRVKSLSQLINNLEFKVGTLEEKWSITPALKSRLAGTVLDEFRMIPITKCIIELFQNGSEEACAKIATDTHGHYACDQLFPGVYEIRVKHPRFLPLVIKDYPIYEGENKYQDFILRRA